YHANLLKRSVVFVSIEVIRVGIVSYKQIGPAVVVEILKNALEAEIKILVGYLGMRGYIGERPVAVVVVERIRRTCIAQRTGAGDPDATVLAGSYFRPGGVEVQMPGNEQIEIAVEIIAPEGSAGMPSVTATDACLTRDIGKSSITPIFI